ncbi:MAG TPA: hypothetical protein VIV54_19755, partial [Burkholderiales bacterium]
KGRYILIDATLPGADVERQLVEALKSIFSEIQAVNSIFASVTLPVSVNVRGTNLNQVYIGVFRPDASRKPRWFGNLKLYNLGVTSSGVLFLADATNGPPPATGIRAENPDTGFISNTAQSFWTTALTGGNEFWSFRTPFDVTDVGMGKDLPDGDIVEKGGAAQRLREVYQLSQATRKVYTCVGASDCVANASKSLSTMPFATANTNITAGALGTYNTKSVTSLTSSGQIATATVAAHGYTAGQTVIISGASPSIYNGTFTILGPSTTPVGAITVNTFQYDMGAAPSALTAQVNATDHKLQTGDTVVVDSITDNAFDTASTGSSVIVPTGDANTFTYDIATAPTVSPSISHTVIGKRAVAQLYSIGSTATVTLPSHQFASSAPFTTVSIEGAAESEFNRTGVTASVIDGNSFTYPLASVPTKVSRKVQVTTSTPHGFNNSDTITIGGVSASYNGTFVITRVSATQFTYSTATDLIADATGGTASRAGTAFSVTSMSHAASSGTVNVTTSAAHGLALGSSVSISGSTYPQYNGTFTLTAVGSTTTFSFSPTNVPAVSAATTPATGAVSVTRLSDGLIRSVTAITHPTSGQTSSQNTATVQTTVNHGFSAGDIVLVAGANQAAYNGAWRIASVGSGGNADKFDFVNDGTAASWPTPAIGTITAGTGVTIAISSLQRVVDATNASSPTGPIRVVRTLSASSIATQTQASGVITVANTSDLNTTDRDLVINWVRGEENNEDEDKNEATGATNNRNPPLTGSPFTVRSTIHGDVLHSRPAVINYGRDGSDNDVYIVYGANDGLLHSIKGGYARSSDSTLNPGEEAWSFVPEEFYSRLKRLRDNAPGVTALSRREYFFDGPIAVYTLDAGASPDGRLRYGDGDKVRMYIGMRRGGRMIYGMDVSNPEDPKYLWKIGCPNLTNNTGCTPGFEELGQTWSEPRIGWIRANSNPVLILGAGYDPAVEDNHPCLITASDATSVTVKVGGSVTFSSTGDCSSTVTSGTQINRSMGRGIFIVDAVNGSLVRYIGGGTSTSTDKTIVSGMSYAMPGDVTVLNRDRDIGLHPGVTGRENSVRGFLDRIYAADTGGNLWRVDIDNATPSAWIVTRLAAIADNATVSATDTRPIGKRKLMFAADVVFTSDANGSFDAVLIGSGDREHPFDTLVVNRFYMFKDRRVGLDATGQGDSASPWAPAITEADLLDVTGNCIQTTTTSCTDAQRAQAQADLLAAKGWKLNLLAGEKAVSSATTLAGTTFFNTNQPVATVDALKCTSNLGTAREYAVSYKDATATTDINASGGINTGDRAAIHAGGGYLPSPVPVIVQIGDKKYQAVISGTSVRDPGGLTLEKRLRTYWYRKIE